MLTLSVITPSFNQGRFLERALRSVIAQRDRVDLEYIVVDPGSTDGSRDIIAAHSAGIDRVLLEPDRGPADGLNKGFAVSSGEVLGYLNADDLLLTGALRQVVDEFAARPGSDVLYGHGLLIDENDTTLRRCWSDRYSLRMAARGLSFIMQPSTFFRRDAFARTGGFNVGNRIAWDAELLLDLALAGASIERVEHLWSAFRIHAEGITGSGAHLGAHAAYLRRAFDRVHGREPGRIDAIAGLPLRLLKHALHPRAAIERWRYGPVAGRPAD
jgi:glycosyltransferase involved in cell wall biosynthesis